MKYAPVVIPTMNRYQHLKRCIDSLSKNSIANKTDLYISIDYPPRKEYQEGYDQIVDYIKNGIEGFNDVFIVYQEKNLGAGGNERFLLEEVWKKEDRLIFTEDDNEFSENFLEYMNILLDKYEADTSVFAIGGYSIPGIGSSKGREYYFTQYMDAWGCGLWREKYREFEQFRKQDIARCITENKQRRLLWKYSKYIYNQALYIVNDKHYMHIYKDGSEEGVFLGIDFIMCIYIFVKNMYFIAPCISKVRNLGFDGSGTNCNSEKQKIYETQLIDDRKTIDIDQAKELSREERTLLKKHRDQYYPKGVKNSIRQAILLSRAKRMYVK